MCLKRGKSGPRAIQESSQGHPSINVYCFQLQVFPLPQEPYKQNSFPKFSLRTMKLNRKKYKFLICILTYILRYHQLMNLKRGKEDLASLSIIVVFHRVLNALESTLRVLYVGRRVPWRELSDAMVWFSFLSFPCMCVFVCARARVCVTWLLTKGQSQFAELERVAPQPRPLLDPLRSLLALPQATLHVPQVLLEPPAIPGPLIHREPQNLPSWCLVRRKSPSFAPLQSPQLLPSNFDLLTSHCQTWKMSSPKSDQLTTSNTSPKGVRLGF